MDEFEKFLDYQQKSAEMTLRLIAGYRKRSKGSTKKSLIEIVESILSNSPDPLHVDQIIAIAKEDYDIDLSKDSVSSSLFKKTQMPDSRFVKTGPNVFHFK